MAEKINRNDPCSCGSGKKYKKCCSMQEKSSEQPAIVINPNTINEEGQIDNQPPAESVSLVGAKNKLNERQKMKVTKTSFKGPKTNTKLTYRTNSGRGK